MFPGSREPIQPFGAHISAAIPTPACGQRVVQGRCLASPQLSSSFCPFFQQPFCLLGLGVGGIEDRKRNNGMGKHRTDFRRQQSECAPPAAAASLGGKVTLMAALSGCHGHRTARNIVLWV